MDGQQTAFGRHAVRERFNVPFYPSLPYTSVPIRWFVCDLHFVFPSTVAPKTRKTYVGKIRKKNKGRRTQLFFRGGCGECVRVSLTHVSSSPNSSLHHPLREKKKDATTPFSSPTRPLCLFHFLTTHKQKLTLETIDQPNQTRNNFRVNRKFMYKRNDSSISKRQCGAI